MQKKIVVIGPESTGKSTLCSMLAQHYQTLWCPEYARDFLTKNGSQYQYADLLTIARGQLALEESYTLQLQSIPGGEASNHPQKTPMLFCDTDMQVMKVWCEYVFNDCHTWILNTIAERQCDLYLLCQPDLPWVQDELREYPDEKPRQELYHIYRDLLIHQSTPWISISGSYAQRFAQAVEGVDGVIG